MDSRPNDQIDDKLVDRKTVTTAYIY